MGAPQGLAVGNASFNTTHWAIVLACADEENKGEAQTRLAPSNDRESVIITTLPNGSYTAIASGYGGATGVGLVEVYNLK